MKYFSQFSISFILLFSVLNLNGQVYVDADANGTNDGSTWANAFTDLSDALSATAGGQIWVADGTYTPGSGSPDTSSSFIISSSISLYGGFNGTESSLDQRNFTMNQTILNGDVNGDDVGDFNTNRTDNVHNIVVVDSLLVGSTIDGFIIDGGHTSNNNDQPEIEWRGGGIFSYSLTVIRNCIFRNNFARSGGGVYLSPNGGGTGCNGSSITDCLFTMNGTSQQGAGIFVSAINGFEVVKCEFSDNTVNRGALYPVNSSNISVRDCRFQRNTGIDNSIFGGAIFSFQNTDFEIRRSLFEENFAGSAGAIYFDGRDLTGPANFLVDSCVFDGNELAYSDAFGGAIFNWQGTGLTISNSIFEDNVAGNGTAIYHDGRDVEIDPNNLIIDNCSFEDNIASDFGGGILYSFNASLTFKNSQGIDNISPNGSHLFISGDDKEVVISGSEFSGGDATFGGAIAAYGSNSKFSISDCNFTENEAVNQGGALIIGFQAEADIKDCTFRLNSADLGGAIRIQNDSTMVSFDNCLFESNDGVVQGGAVYQGGGSNVTFDNSSFFVNTSEGLGGALALVTFNDDAEQGTASINNCIFNFNSGGTAGGAIGLIDMPTDITNTLIHDNLLSDTEGVGGGLYYEVSDSNTAVVNIINTTFANNFGTIGSGIGLFRGEVETSMTMNLQNTLNFNNGDNMAISAGDGLDPEIFSMGGNLSSDGTFTAVLTMASDQHDVADAMFVDPITSFDFHLLEGSPAIDAGVSTGAPTTDIEGTARFGEVDAGAYEFDPTSSVWDQLDNSVLTIAPNPVKEVLNYELNENLIGKTYFSIYSNSGQLMQSWNSEKLNNSLRDQIQLNDIPAGSYRLFVKMKGKIVSKQFVKI